MDREFDAKWHELAEEVISGMKEWRQQHVRATLSEIAEALDERLARMRVQILTDTALASSAREITSAAEGERVEARGKQERMLTSQHNQVVRLERSYAVCPQCGAGFFPSG